MGSEDPAVDRGGRAGGGRVDAGSTPSCPFCDSPDVEHVSQWGGQMITRQCRCASCNTYFEAIREEFGPA